VTDRLQLMGDSVPSLFAVGGVTVGLVSDDVLVAGAGNGLDQMIVVVVDAQGGGRRLRW
jgi:hypothetical protein